MLLPAMTTELAQRIEQNDGDYTLSRLAGMQRAEGNPLGIEIQQFGPATAFLVRAWPDFWYGNKVLGLDPAGVNQLGDITAFFQRHQLDFRFEIRPGNLNSTLATRLYNLGFCQMSFSAALYGQPQLTSPVPGSKDVHVREVEPDEIDLFLDTYQDGFELPRLTEAERRVVQTWLEQVKSELYLSIAWVKDRPAGVSILFVKDGLGLLADAATSPAFRGQGCHLALIQHRLLEAARRGCELLTSFVEFGGASHRNLGRVGLRVAYTKALWWRVE
jgi:GNAT superfamily N-acetyltransferase